MHIYFDTQTLNGFVSELTSRATDDRSTANILLVGGRKIDLDAHPNLRGIFKTGVGTDNLPFEEAKKRGIEIALPCEATRSIIYRETADFACHRILQCLYRKLGCFETWTKEPRNALQRKTLLVVGTGKIGAMVRNKMAAFCNTITFDSLTNESGELRPMVEMADCVSLHIPLLDSTHGFFDSEKLRWMKDGASLVNTARGPIIDEQALLNELQTGRIFAALDVFSNEPYNGPLCELSPDKISLSPHVASTCSDFLAATAKDFRDFIAKLSA
ncbi:phosphoglycerate dehydrogenase-like enzyme [Rhodopirellula rubra]|uniref:Phosphoglycerate dehydrogenase-like enzyme n=1 Tax=Aporhodopirellula rubra TaxID=980271 RepID=A0A7W5DXC8_9BACT|nr:NAD(P)-dependent oxidoreductase [Aporhodopirellula rubra]MBB3206268.1 phosphoglycerate dehydrogenase-like enzyme [Aporhodopirellula rubra]